MKSKCILIYELFYCNKELFRRYVPKLHFEGNIFLFSWGMKVKDVHSCFDANES